MRGAIAYALSWPDRAPLPLERLDFAALGALEFRAPDETRFPALRLARAALEAGGAAGCVLNAAKETALEAFIAEKIGFLAMACIVEEAMERLHPWGEADTLDAVLDLDAAARRTALSLCAAAA
jgi:1-deoxy-D-xylulose-5-phosphate reductoisomerase